MTAPTAFYDVAEIVLDCVCEQMTTVKDTIPTYGGCPCLVYVSPGEPAFDACCRPCDGSAHGQLTVQIEDVFPSANFPSGEQFLFPCKAAAWVVSVRIIVARCIPTMDEQGRIDPAAQSAAAEMLATDLYAVLQALTCCVTADAVPGKTKRRVSISAVGNVEIPSEGGCGGIEVRAAIEAGPVCGCPEGS